MSVVLSSASASAGGAASVISALGVLIWPLVVIIAICLYHAPLTRALSRVSEVDVAGAKVTLQGQADTAANVAKKAAGVTPDLPASSSAMQSAAANATKDPAGAVLDAWKDVEDTIKSHAATLPGASSASVPEVVRSLVPHGLDESLESVAKNLESVRGVAASGGDVISKATAVSFVSAAEDLSRLINKASSAGRQ